MNKNIENLLIVCACFMLALVSAHIACILDENSQQISYGSGNSGYFYVSDGSEPLYFVYNDTPHLIISIKNNVHTCYVWNNTEWVISEVDYGLPDGYVEGELIEINFTWTNLTEERL